VYQGTSKRIPHSLALSSTRSHTAASSVPSFSAIAKGEIAPGPGVESDGEWADYLRATAETVFHASGTCRMGGANDPLAVTSPNGLVRGVEGLRVADASLFPAMVTVNINNTVTMAAEKIADAVLSNH